MTLVTYGLRLVHLIMFCMPMTQCPVVMATPEASLSVALKRPPELKSRAAAVLQERSLKQREYPDDCVRPGRPRTPSSSSGTDVRCRQRHASVTSL